MKALVTGSAGHLGEALVRALRQRGDIAVGIDLLASPFTDIVGSVTDRGMVEAAMQGCEVVFHAATLHKPHVGTHPRQAFVDVNVTGTLNVLEAAAAAKVARVVFTSTTSVFGDALRPNAADGAAVWVTEDLTPRSKNVYGATKAAAEDLCRLFHRNQKLPCTILRTSRFFPEEDDNAATRRAFSDANAKVTEFLYRRVDLEDVVTAHLLAAERPASRACETYIISATTPFHPEDAGELGRNAGEVIRRRLPAAAAAFARLGWRFPHAIDRVYVNERARASLGWTPQSGFTEVLERVLRTGHWAGPIAQVVGSKGYHAEKFTDGPYPLDTGNT